MLRIALKREAGDTPCAPARHVVLPYAERCKSRLRVRLDDGSEAGLFLPRGTVLHGGDVLLDDAGGEIQVIAAAEALYEVRAADGATDPHFDLMRAAYHLGNRHVPLQLAPRALRLERDPVLRDMLQGLGVAIHDITAPFEPEAGAYGGGHRHDHDASGGVIGELLSREAHARTVPDFSRARFHATS